MRSTAVCGSTPATDPNDPNTAIVAHYEYDVYGNRINPLDPNDPNDTEFEQPFRYATKWRDPDTGLVDFGRRWYFADHGRWLNRDPIGTAGGVNIYAYAMNDPANQIDPLGLLLPCPDYLACAPTEHSFDWCPSDSGGGGGGGNGGGPPSGPDGFSGPHGPGTPPLWPDCSSGLCFGGGTAGPSGGLSGGASLAAAQATALAAILALATVDCAQLTTAQINAEAKIRAYEELVGTLAGELNYRAQQLRDQLARAIESARSRCTGGTIAPPAPPLPPPPPPPVPPKRPRAFCEWLKLAYKTMCDHMPRRCKGGGLMSCSQLAFRAANGSACAMLRSIHTTRCIPKSQRDKGHYTQERQVLQGVSRCLRFMREQDCFGKDVKPEY